MSDKKMWGLSSGRFLYFYGLGQGCPLADDYEFEKVSNVIGQYANGSLIAEQERDLGDIGFNRIIK